MTDPRALLALAEDTARAAADLLRSRLTDTLQVSHKSTDTDLVTDVDRACEHLIVSLITAQRPGDGIVGEEGTALRGSTGVDWVIDPLDGTTNFVYGHPGFSVSIGATIDGEPAIGVVADPVHGELFSARRGSGAHRNGVPIRCSNRDRLDHALAATGFSYQPGVRRRQAEVLAGIIPSLRDIRRMGGAAIDLCSVACGRVDVFFEQGLQPWDFAAGALIAAESGARVTNLDGGAPSGDFCIAAPPALHDGLIDLIMTASAARS